MFAHWRGKKRHTMEVKGDDHFFQANGLIPCFLGGDTLGVEFPVVGYPRL